MAVARRVDGQTGVRPAQGKWITHLELELLEKTGAERAAEQVWFPKVKQWAGWLSGRDPRRIAEGLQNLRAIDDPDAVSALWNYLGQQSNPEYRQLFVQVAGQLKGPKPVRRLSQGMLAESNELIFRQALDTIDADQKTEVVKYCLPGLKDKSNDVVQRAAIVVGKFGDERVIPDLIDALITTHRYKIQVPDTSNTIGFGVASNGVPTMLPSGNMAMIPSDIEIMSRLGQLPYGYTGQRPHSETHADRQHQNGHPKYQGAGGAQRDHPAGLRLRPAGLAAVVDAQEGCDVERN